jgi:hypothetical protein
VALPLPCGETGQARWEINPRKRAFDLELSTEHFPPCCEALHETLSTPVKSWHLSAINLNLAIGQTQSRQGSQEVFDCPYSSQASTALGRTDFCDAYGKAVIALAKPEALFTRMKTDGCVKARMQTNP